MRKYLQYVLLGIIITFTLVFAVMFYINIRMSSSRLVFSQNENYEKLLVDLDNRLDNMEDQVCSNALKRYRDFSEETYFKEDVKPEKWIRLFYSEAYTPLDYIKNIMDKCSLNDVEKEKMVNSYVLVSTTYDHLTTDAIYNYELSFSDVYFRELSQPDISTTSYSVAKIQELYIIKDVLDYVEGVKND